MDYILEVENLSKKRKSSNFYLDNVSFNLPYGAIMGFVGENGAGKTTTISCLLNTVFKDSGKIKLFGEEMKDEDTGLRENIGVVFDASNFSQYLDPHKLSKVMSGIYSKWQHEVFIEYMKKFDLPISKRLKTFSKGMLMKLSIAVALSHQAKLLVLDEPTSGLDPIVRDEILEILLDFVQDEKCSVFLSSHITSDLEKVADYIIFIHQGKVILDASKDDLIYNYGLMRCKKMEFEQLDKDDIVGYRKRDYQIDVLIKDRDLMKQKYKDIVMDSVSIDDIMLLLVKGDRA